MSLLDTTKSDVACCYFGYPQPGGVPAGVKNGAGGQGLGWRECISGQSDKPIFAFPSEMSPYSKDKDMVTLKLVTLSSRAVTLG